MRVWVEDVHRHVDTEVTLRGWLYGRRSSGKLHFLQLRDGTGTIQCVVFVKDVAPEVFWATDALIRLVTREAAALASGQAAGPAFVDDGSYVAIPEGGTF